MASIAASSASTNDAFPGMAVVLYDGQCQLCQRSVRLLKRLDWLKKLHCQDCRDTIHLPSCEVRLDPEQMLEQMHVVTPDRQRAYAGFAAIRWMAWRLPLSWCMAPLLYLPGVPWLGNKLYLWIARNRYDLVPCSHGQCSLPRSRDH